MSYYPTEEEKAQLRQIDEEQYNDLSLDHDHHAVRVIRKRNGWMFVSSRNRHGDVNCCYNWESLQYVPELRMRILNAYKAT